MHSILLVVERPVLISPEQRNAIAEGEYTDAMNNIRQLMNTNTRIEALAENVLLIPIDDTLNGLSEAVLGIGDGAYSYTILTEDNRWHKVASRTNSV